MLEKYGITQSPGSTQVLQDGTELPISMHTVPELLQARLGTGLELSSPYRAYHSHGVAHKTPKPYARVSPSSQMQPSARLKTATVATEALFLKIQ